MSRAGAASTSPDITQAQGCVDGCGTAPKGAAGHGGAVAKVLLLSWFSLLWMTVEGLLGLYAGVQANSISLIGWALGSVIEGLASVIVIWRFTGSRRLSETAERNAQKAVAVSFWLLAPYIAVEGLRDLFGGHHVETAVLGIVVTASSLLVMPALGVAKRRLGEHLDSEATAGEGTQNLLCAAQAAAVLIGLAVHAVTGVDWVDPVIALALAAWAVREGLEAWRGEDCC
ncbi:MAG: putative conserved integral rane protein [Frankiales bacterium]|nr:putative conserved integral rane protein [Frankiales bacterium]